MGKSCAIDRIIEAAVGSGRYDLVIALAPTRRVLEERAWIRTPPSGLKIVNLRPRPRQRCGDLDGPWRHFEQAGMAALGRVELCGRCPRRPGCFWPRQFGKGLEGAQVIFGTDAHIARSPDFSSQLAGWAGAARVLTLVDEINFLATGFRRRVARADLVRFARVLGEVDSGRWGAFHGDWCWRTELLLRAPSADLRHPDWRMPTFPIDWAVEVQARGWEAHDTRFRFLGHDLQQFGRSPLESRERHANGDLSFAAPPAVRGDVAIFSGTALPEFLRFRLGRDLACPFAGYQFGHPGTRWFNIASRLGMRAHFPGNADQILDFFASLVSRRLSEGRRPLLIAKKRFVESLLPGAGLQLAEIHPSPVEIVTNDWDTTDLMRPDVIPLITFGLIGTNLFEHFDGAYCLTGFYVNAEIVDTILQDVLASDGTSRSPSAPREVRGVVTLASRTRASASTTWTDWPNSLSTSKRWTLCSRPSAASGPTRGRVRSYFSSAPATRSWTTTASSPRSRRPANSSHSPRAANGSGTGTPTESGPHDRRG